MDCLLKLPVESLKKLLQEEVRRTFRGEAQIVDVMDGKSAKIELLYVTVAVTVDGKARSEQSSSKRLVAEKVRQIEALVGEMSIREIAAKLGLPKTTVEYHVYRVRSRQAIAAGSATSDAPEPPFRGDDDGAGT